MIIISIITNATIPKATILNVPVIKTMVHNATVIKATILNETVIKVMVLMMMMMVI
jgi:hypothetical protein